MSLPDCPYRCPLANGQQSIGHQWQHLCHAAEHEVSDGITLSWCESLLSVELCPEGWR